MAKRSDRIEDLMPNKEAYEELGVSRMTLWEWTRDGVIEAVKMGASVFFRREDVERLKQEREAQK